jgi:hypothetical protein
LRMALWAASTRITSKYLYVESWKLKVKSAKYYVQTCLEPEKDERGASISDRLQKLIMAWPSLTCQVKAISNTVSFTRQSCACIEMGPTQVSNYNHTCLHRNRVNTSF